MRTGNAQYYTEEHSAPQHAALLFMAGFGQSAIDHLEDSIAGGAGAILPQSWLVLFDLYHATDRADAFDRLAQAYARAFPDAPRPVWGNPTPIASAGTLALQGVLDRKSGWLDTFKEHARARQTLALDMSQVDRIDFAMLGEFAAVLRTLRLQGRRVILANISELNCAALEAFGAEQDAVFMRRRVHKLAGRAAGRVAVEGVAALHLQAA